MTNILKSTWFPEPATEDDTWARRGEDTWSWLARSTLPRAQACRAFLRENIATLPDAWQARLVHDLQHRWHSAFFELVAARTLQVLGGSLVVEAELANGKRPDFVAEFSDASVTVEATSPVIDKGLGETVKRQMPLLDIVEAHAPKGWWTNVIDLPDLGLGACRRCKRKVRRAIAALLAVPPPALPEAPLHLHTHLPYGRIKFELWPRNAEPEGRGIGMEPIQTIWDDTQARIRVALKGKRRQVREAQHPALVAINASGMASELEDFDVALFGHTVDVRDRRRRQIAVRFDRDGAFFDTGGGGSPTCAGVLAYRAVSFRGTHDPVLYIHPRYNGPLPAALLDLEVRRFDCESNRINVQVARRTGVMLGLGEVAA